MLPHVLMLLDFAASAATVTVTVLPVSCAITSQRLTDCAITSQRLTDCAVTSQPLTDCAITITG